MPTEAYIYDAIRTPRGRGKANGSLHEVRPLDVLKTLFDELRQRHYRDTSQVDDVLLLCFNPVQDHVGKLPRNFDVAPTLDKVRHQRFGHTRVDMIHRHVVTVESGPAQRQFREITRADDETADLVGNVHQNLCALARL